MPGDGCGGADYRGLAAAGSGSPPATATHPEEDLGSVEEHGFGGAESTTQSSSSSLKG